MRVIVHGVNDAVEVAEIARENRSRGSRSIHIYGSTLFPDRGERGPIPHLATFSSMFSGLWTRLEELNIGWAEWRVGDIRADSFLDLSTFSTITRLVLMDVTFPTVVTFGHLVCSFGNLQELQCFRLFYLAPHPDIHVFPTFAARRKLKSLSSWRSDDTGIIAFLVATKIVANLEDINTNGYQPFDISSDVVPSAAYQYLVHAASSLRRLRLVHLHRKPDQSSVTGTSQSVSTSVSLSSCTGIPLL